MLMSVHINMCKNKLNNIPIISQCLFSQPCMLRVCNMEIRSGREQEYEEKMIVQRGYTEIPLHYLYNL